MPHIPVLLKAVMDAFAPRPQSRFLDATFGAGGHTRALLDSAPGVEVVALDQDPEAQERAQTVLNAYPERFRFYPMNFENIGSLEEAPFDGILFDLGLSSFQLDTAQRGFSFRLKGPVDMRMNPEQGICAKEFIETATPEQLTQALRDFGEEPQWRKVVQTLIEARGTPALDDTTALAQLICNTLRRSPRPGQIHPATRSFQGLRIAVNRELHVIHEALPAAFDKLKPQGILAIISFHSLEDRIVKRAFRRLAGRPEHRNDDTPQQERQPQGRLISTKALVPGAEEIQNNPRSRSARLRLFQKN